MSLDQFLDLRKGWYNNHRPCAVALRVDCRKERKEKDKSKRDVDVDVCSSTFRVIYYAMSIGVFNTLSTWRGSGWSRSRLCSLLGTDWSTDVESERLGAGKAKLLKEMDLRGRCCVGVSIEVRGSFDAGPPRNSNTGGDAPSP